MASPVVRVDASRIADRGSFHDVFAEAFGFFDGYGRNMDAWIDCLSSLGQPFDGMTQVHAPTGGVVVLQLDHADDFSERCPALYEDLVDCAAFVNWRLLERGHPPILALSFRKTNRRS